MEQRTPQPYEFVRIAVMLITLASLALICFYLVDSSFEVDAATGIRSIAGIMLPLVIGGFLAVFKRSLFEKAARVSPTIAFLLAAVFAVAIMLLIENIEFSGAAVRDTNGAGIRHEGGDLRLHNTFFHDNEFSMLTGKRPLASIEISSSRFWYQKRPLRHSHRHCPGIRGLGGRAPRRLVL